MRQLTRGPSFQHLVLLLVLSWVTSSQAASLSVDTNDSAPGIQPARSVDPRDQLTVAIRLDGVLPSEGLSGFEVDLDYDPLVVQVVGLANGDFLTTPVRVFENDGAAPDANFAAFTEGGAASDGSGVLALVTFEALAPGSTELVINDARLAVATGGSLFPDAAASASITVVPEPGFPTALVLGAASLFFGARTRRRATLTIGAGLALISATTAAAQSVYAVDVVRDGRVDVLDVTLVDRCLGMDPAVVGECERADVDADADIDSVDLESVIAAFGTDLGPPLSARSALRL